MKIVGKMIYLLLKIQYAETQSQLPFFLSIIVSTLTTHSEFRNCTYWSAQWSFNRGFESTFLYNCLDSFLTIPPNVKI